MKSGDAGIFPVYYSLNVSVQHNIKFLPGIILLAQCYYHRGTRLNAMKRNCICSLLSYPNVLTFFPLTGRCSEGLDAFRFFFQKIGANSLEHKERYDTITDDEWYILVKV